MAVTILGLLYVNLCNMLYTILLRVLRQIKGVIHSFVELLIEAVLCVQCCITTASRAMHTLLLCFMLQVFLLLISSLYHSTSFSSVPTSKDKFIPSSKAGCHCCHRSTQKTQFTFYCKDVETEIIFLLRSTMDIGQDRH